MDFVTINHSRVDVETELRVIDSIPELELREMFGGTPAYLNVVKAVMELGQEYGGSLLWGTLRRLLKERSNIDPSTILKMLIDDRMITIPQIPSQGSSISPMKLSLRRALEIQANQLEYYCGDGEPWSNAVIQLIKAKTDLALTGVKDYSTPLGIVEVNQMVPRGGAIESAIAKWKQYNPHRLQAS